LQRISLRHGIRLPPAFALVGKTLAQADFIARMLDPTLDPVELIRDDALGLMTAEAEQKLQPEQLLGYVFTQLDSVSRLPRRAGQGTVKVGGVAAGLEEVEHVVRSVANRIGAAMIVVGLLVSSALMARVSDELALAGFCLSGVIALYMVWRIIRSPGEL